jgi:chemotaxis methyl-accepting protein methylase
MITALFRDGTYLEEALALAVERAEDTERLSVISAGCSIGAEADSILALHSLMGYEGRVDIIGYDINGLALQMARRGVHELTRHKGGDPAYATERLESAAQALTDLGFGIGHDVQDHGGNNETTPVTVDAAPLRAGHTVRFAEHDLGNPLPRTRPANLILANNMLTYCRDNYETVARNLAGMLADRGVLSFGSDGLPDGIPQTETIVHALQDFDMQPIFHGEEGQRVMFGRA